MKEKERQELLKTGRGITLRQLEELIARSSYESWSGCQSGGGWRGTVIKFGDHRLNDGRHTQNDSPTGFERRGRSSYDGAKVRPKRGDKVVIHNRRGAGRSAEGEVWYKTEVTELVVV